MSRQDANLAILERLLEAVEAEPDQRFGQLLWNFGVLMPGGEGGIKDPYNDESVAILRRMEKRIQQLNQWRSNGKWQSPARGLSAMVCRLSCSACSAF